MRSILAFWLILGAALWAQEETPASEWIIVSGGPAIRYFERDKASSHDKYWGNFIDSGKKRIAQLQEQGVEPTQVTWLVFRPGYVSRGRELGADWLAEVMRAARLLGARLLWFDTKDQLINYLNRGQDRGSVLVAGFDYFGHSNKACFLFDYSNEFDGMSADYLHAKDLNRVNRNIFARGAVCKSWGCHSGEYYSAVWKSRFSVPMEGAIGKTDYSRGGLPFISTAGGPLGPVMEGLRMKIEGKNLVALALTLVWTVSGWTQEEASPETPAPLENHIAVPPSSTPSTPAPAVETDPEAAPVVPPPPAPVAEPKPPAPDEDFMPSSAEPVEKPKPEEKKVVTLGQVGVAEGEMFIGHRFYEEKGGGWGWIKRPNESWNQAIWVVLKETPGKIVAPFRRNSGRSADHNYEYKMWGEFNGESAYDPHRDEVMPAFLLKGYQTIGPAEPLARKPGSPDRFNKQKKSRAGSRTNPVAERLNQAY